MPLQKKRYYTGIGSEDNIGHLQRLEAGAFGTGFQDQIREVYEVSFCHDPLISYSNRTTALLHAFKSSTK